MFRNLCTLVAAALLFGCAATRDGLDYASVSKTYGGPQKGQGRIVVLWDQGFNVPWTMDTMSASTMSQSASSRTGTFHLC